MKKENIFLKDGLPKILFKIIFWLCWIMLSINLISLISNIFLSAFYHFAVKIELLSFIPHLPQRPLRIGWVISFLSLLTTISYWFLFQQMARDILHQKFFCWSNVIRLRLIALLTAADIILSIALSMLMQQDLQRFLDFPSLVAQSQNAMFSSLRSLVLALLWMGLSYLLAESVTIKEDQHLTI